MAHFKFRGANDAFRGMVRVFQNGTDHEDRRNVPISRVPYSNPNGSGYTLRLDEPVTITYSRPAECVLFNQARDCNPFALLYEGLYHLCGRQDVAPLAYYTPRFKTFSDDGETFNASYGYRWRHADHGPEPYTDGTYQGADQLDLLVAHLKANPTSRRAVLAIWNVEDDLLNIGTPCESCDGIGWTEKQDRYGGPNAPKCPKCGGNGGKGSRDVACNLMVKFSVRETSEPGAADELNRRLRAAGVPVEAVRAEPARVLDMTVFNRSNDLVWGALGANMVTFSFLQQYMAARLGVSVGRYNQISDDLHVYDRHVEEMPKWLAAYDGIKGNNEYDGYTGEGIQFRTPFPLVRDPATFDREVKQLVETYHGDPERTTYAGGYAEPFLETVAAPALEAFAIHKSRRDTAGAILRAEDVAADDWRIACVSWLKRRQK